MGEDSRERRASTTALDRLGIAGGFIVFLVGVALIALVFTWSYHLFTSIETLIDSAAPHSSSPSSASPARTLGQVATIIGLKAGLLLVLGYCGGLLATKGAQMAAASHGRRPEE
jgi:hypothetical protein